MQGKHFTHLSNTDCLPMLAADPVWRSICGLCVVGIDLKELSANASHALAEQPGMTERIPSGSTLTRRVPTRIWNAEDR